MEKMKDLKDLLKHEVMDLYSAEEQIIEALPKMIDKAKDPALKKALREHLNVTEKQKTRLDKVQQLLREKGEAAPFEKKGFLSGLFGGGGQKCKGTQGLIEEGEKIMGEDMNAEVMDAAIIASAQKIEHYEICGYGTAKAFALELKLNNVAELLDQTLNEEYTADNLLTKMAVGRLNQEAEEADGMHKPGKNRGAQNNKMPVKSNSTKTGNKAAATTTKTGSKSSSNSRPSSGNASKSNAPAKKRTAFSKTGSSGTSNSKTAAKKTAPKKAATKSSRPRLGR
jgi:ferritin-like metal-binding protein YciE